MYTYTDIEGEDDSLLLLLLKGLRCVSACIDKVKCTRYKLYEFGVPWAPVDIRSFRSIGRYTETLPYGSKLLPWALTNIWGERTLIALNEHPTIAPHGFHQQLKTYTSDSSRLHILHDIG